MIKKLLDSVLELMTSLTHYEFGSERFFVIFALSALLWVVVARGFMGIFDSKCGVASAFLALVLPLSSGLLAYSLAEVQLVPLVGAAWAEKYLPIGIFFLVLLLVAVFACKRLIGLTRLFGFIVFVFASATAALAFYATEFVLETLDEGSEQIKQREERNQKEIDSVM